MKVFEIGILLSVASWASAACPLIEYESDKIKGLDGLVVLIHPEFLPWAHIMENAAKDCDVNTLLVAHAFREAGKNPDGSVEAPPTLTDHYVGHALDAFLDTPSGYCNQDCLYETYHNNPSYNQEANCYLKIIKSTDLRYGGDWATPSDHSWANHIDDGLYSYVYEYWESLYYEIQSECV